MGKIISAVIILNPTRSVRREISTLAAEPGRVYTVNICVMPKGMKYIANTAVRNIQNSVARGFIDGKKK
jgi:hypothetical protein